MRSQADRNETQTGLLTSTSARQTDKKRILIVDDDPKICSVLKAGLERAGKCEVRTETRPEKTLSVACEFQPHLIVVDVMLPGTDGGAVAAEVKADPRLKNPAIVFLTGAITKEEIKRHGGRIGSHVFLAKPVSIGELLACIEKELDR